jgi:hypothetical protein
VLATIKASGGVSTTEVVAIVGAFSTPAVAFAGYWFNQRRAAQDRDANRVLLQDTQSHEKELADAAQSHERTLRRGERAYADRSASYRHVIRWTFRTIQQVQLTEPIVKTSDMPEPPESLSDEEWRTMMTEVRLFGSRDVSDAMETRGASSARPDGRGPTDGAPLPVRSSTRVDAGAAPKALKLSPRLDGAVVAAPARLRASLTGRCRDELSCAAGVPPRSPATPPRGPGTPGAPAVPSVRRFIARHPGGVAGSVDGPRCERGSSSIRGRS